MMSPIVGTIVTGMHDHGSAQGIRFTGRVTEVWNSEPGMHDVQVMFNGCDAYDFVWVNRDELWGEVDACYLGM